MPTQSIGRFYHMNNVKLIGIGAIARVGKDTLADLLVDHYKNDGFYAKKYQLAKMLKADMEDFIDKKCGLNVWSEDDEKKRIFRPLLVSYGFAQREMTRGTYWTNIVSKQIEEDIKQIESETGPLRKPYVAVVSDIRYAVYENDEHQWIKSNNGTLIYLDRMDTTGKLIEPANLDEAQNAPKVKAAADFSLVWETAENVKSSWYCFDLSRNLYRQLSK